MFSIRSEIRSHVQHSIRESVTGRCVETQIPCDSSIAVVDAADCGKMQKEQWFIRSSTVYQIECSLSDRVQFIRSSAVYQIEYSLSDRVQFIRSSTVYQVEYSLSGRVQFIRSSAVYQIEYSLSGRVQFIRSSAVYQIEYSCDCYSCQVIFS